MKFVQFLDISLAILFSTLSVCYCRGMCYTCSYTINSLQQGLECVDAPKNVTIGQWASQCPYKCLITTQITIETMEVRSFNRMCGFTNGEDRCEVHGPYEICYETCDDNFCNDGVLGLLKEVLEDEENKTTINTLSLYFFLILPLLYVFG